MSSKEFRDLLKEAHRHGVSLMLPQALRKAAPTPVSMTTLAPLMKLVGERPLQKIIKPETTTLALLKPAKRSPGAKRRAAIKT